VGYNIAMARRRRVIIPTKHTFSKYAPDYLDEVYLLASTGMTDEDICKTFGISARKLSIWRTQYPSLDEAILKGRLQPDMRVLQSAYLRAVGYEVPTRVKTVTTGDDGQQRVEIKESVTHIPGDPGMIKFLLQNRMPDQFKDKTEVELKVELGDKLAKALARVAVPSLPEGRVIDVSPASGTEAAELIAADAALPEPSP
jgi:hypothetical protein